MLDLHPRQPESSLRAAKARITQSLRREMSKRERDAIEASSASDLQLRTIPNEAFFRSRVISWLLKATPPKGFFGGSSPLGAHLKYDIGTRLLAVQLFTRCLLRQSDVTVQPDEIRDWHCGLWDLALACFSIAVKFTQRIVLKTLDYMTYDVTPLTYLPDLRSALPSLQATLRYGDSWCRTEQLALSIYQDAVLATIIVDALIEIVAAEDQVAPRAICAYLSNPVSLNPSWDAIQLAADDIFRILDVKEEEWNLCREWIENVRMY
ncbi:uncharacterized protein EI90DRAFT_3213449 [Cantharellus anzutake]|uniref:uncharacterized protein n=1 Tax=Cantharellus anzutake TaxID=1750568 RepID=UPI001905D46A|nr:uncharacterized protein EI90DRAFT_3213449 [Cantharellus anzutake]KAF8328839.1 hypothetical protein EI90DRAFT_3213449 [Cantharellus anzutake]